MHDIICPHCHKAFKVDEAGYADILQQVRDSEFEQQLHERLVLAEQDKQAALALAQAQASSQLQQAASAKDSKIQALQSKLDAVEIERQLAVAQALGAVEKERDALAHRLQQAQNEQQAAASLAEARLASELQKAQASQSADIQALQTRLAQMGSEHQLALSEAVHCVSQERDALVHQLQRAELEKALAEQSLKDKYETQIKDREDMIERLRDMKAKLSTKMVGETLEQHCEIEFNRIRATAFPQVLNHNQN